MSDDCNSIRTLQRKAYELRLMALETALRAKKGHIPPAYSWAEVLASSGQHPKLRRLSLGDNFLLGSASREWAAEKFGLTQPQIETVVREMLMVAPE